MDEGSEEQVSPRKSRKSVIITTLGTIVVVVLTVLYVFGITYKSAYSSSRYAQGAVTLKSNNAYLLHLAIQVSVATGPHADWLGYQTETAVPHPGTVFNVPHNSLVTAVIHNFDSQTAPRNPFFGLVQGTVGGVEYVNGKQLKVMDPSITSHTFTIPEFGVSVPMAGVPSNAKPNSFETMKFTFRVPNRKGVYSWQCFIPCGSGLYGNGGPMSEIGYMQGLITVT